ncbi:VOC family protein [Amycolatopsis rhabdoformis]|uniref:VOC family protein n=1 Tax=Amycolatopsis rhabdoformis TaxID=1448059 RepID=A0ABZ1IKK0_9PSEU|nr:VOC family protein [Amycolatopsis rhabdoformis]WSE34719.1 VOC family protein [Amycolatopsis rhabdoformis]
MALHKMAAVVIGVPNLAETAAYYTQFGLTPRADGWFSTVDGGNQLRLVESAMRRLVSFTVGVDDPDDLDRAEARLRAVEAVVSRRGDRLTAIDPIGGVEVALEVQPRLRQPEIPATAYNGPGRIERAGARAPGVLRTTEIKPRKLGHVVLGTTDFAASERFFVEGIGFKVSDLIKGTGAFLRCSTDHHNLLLLKAPVSFLHHTSWQVEDIDEVGRGATRMLEDHPERHVWGLGRHHAGSNFFWYLKDPAGNFSEYYSDLDCILEDQLWKPEAFVGAAGLFNWGPPPPPSFLHPDDLAALMTGAHAPG